MTVRRKRTTSARRTRPSEKTVTKSRTKRRPSKKTDAGIAELSTRNLAAISRPKKLEDFVGQPHVTKVVNGWLKSKQFPATILVVGETGSGKTTLAKLIARYVNCETLDACGVCGYCSYEDELPDVVHINCGERSTVDEIRALLSGSKMMPRYRRRIYILDEAHLLSPKALEALLVPLENPPPGTIWILCTTEENKIKGTLNNRCQKLHIKPVDPDVIADRLEVILRNEGIKLPNKKVLDEVLTTISDFSEGQVRKAISDLDVFISAVRSGEVDFKASDFLSFYERQSGSDLDKLAASLLVYILNEDLPKFVSICSKSNKQAKGLISKFSWLMQWLVQYEAGSIKYVPYIGQVWQRAAKAGKVGDHSLALLLHIGYVAQEIDRNILQTPGLNADMFLMTKFSDMIISNVFSDLRK